MAEVYQITRSVERMERDNFAHKRKPNISLHVPVAVLQEIAI